VSGFFEVVKLWPASIIGLSVLSTCAPVYAQQLQQDQSLYGPSRNVSVTERPHPEYDPLPIREGAFTILPRLDVGVESNDNVYASETDVRGDTVATVDPRIDLASNWSRNALQGFVRSSTRAYARYASNTTTDWQADINGRVDLGRSSQLTGGVDTGYLTEPRYATNTAQAAKTPVRYDQTDAFVEDQNVFDRVLISSRVDFQYLGYSNAENDAGLLIVQNDRNHAALTYSGKAVYAFSPALSVFLSGAYNQHRYDFLPPVVSLNRNSDGDQLALGAHFDLFRLMRGDIQFGYLNQKFADPRLSTISGLSALGKLEYFLTPLTTLTLTGSRGVQDAAIDGSPAYLAQVLGLQADHELLRNLILTAKGSYEDDTYDGIDRHDRLLLASLAAVYRMNRLVALTLTYDHLNLGSNGTDRGLRYTVNRLSLSSSLRF
jgi:hypothetical protein